VFKRGVAHKSMRFSIVEPLGSEKLGLTGFANWRGPDERFGLFGQRSKRIGFTFTTLFFRWFGLGHEHSA
jgi:hypothetical protein